MELVILGCFEMVMQGVSFYSGYRAGIKEMPEPKMSFGKEEEISQPESPELVNDEDYLKTIKTYEKSIAEQTIG